MTLIKSLLLGSAAGIVAVATAQAADLPTRKAAPVEYVRVCNVGGITGWTLPGSDTCVKFSGYITAQFEGGNLSTQYNQAGFATVANSLSAADPALPALVALALRSGATGTYPTLSGGFSSQRVLIAASDAQKNTTFYRNMTGWTTRANFGFDMASNTAYGPLIGHFDINSEAANGFDAVGGTTYLNTGYLTWAGITAGKAQSFFSFVGGGDNWANFASPDRKGFNEPTLLAYTASFGGGFSATISAESPGGFSAGGSGGGTQFAPPGATYGGQRWPDIVGALHVKQGWGEAQVSGVIHNVNVDYSGYDGTAGVAGCGIATVGIVNCDQRQSKVGWGVDAGVKFNLTGWGGMFGAGDDVLLTGAYTRNAVWYSGLPDMMWGENGQVNGNGQAMAMYDTWWNPLTNQWSSPTAWSISGLLEHHFTPQFYLNLEGSVGQLKWSNQGGGCYVLGFGCGLAQAVQGGLSPSATTWLLGADLGWMPVTNLNFDLELMYQSTNQEKPSGFLGTIYNAGGVGGAVFVPGDWHGTSDGFAGRLRITRYF